MPTAPAEANSPSVSTATAALWLASGIVVSCRIGLSRNIAEFPFLDVCSVDQRIEIESAVRASVRWNNQIKDLTIVDCQQLELMEHQFLAELEAVVGLSGRASSTVAAEPSIGDESLHSCLIINEEDHFRIQVTSRHAELISAWDAANQIDDELEQRLNLAFSPRWGFLTACPSNVGTGLRASVVVHVPALMVSGGIHELQRRLARSNVVGREVFGDPAGGDFYRFSNQATLGFDETTLVEQVAQIIPQIVAAESEARENWLTTDRAGLQREVQSSLERLRALDLTDTTDQNRFELTRLLSRVRLGLQLELLPTTQTESIVCKFELIQSRERLLTAIAQEDYGAASRFRDRIKFLSGESV